MADRTYSTFANAAGIATITVQQNLSGLVWVVMQLSISTLPYRVGSTAVGQKNGQTFLNSALGSGDTAEGPPYIQLLPHDQLSIVWTGLTQGDNASLTLFYGEYFYGRVPPNIGGVV